MKNNELVFVALGGTGVIGMNLSAYGFGPAAKRQWLIVDCGVAFAGPDLPGIDLIMPDIRFLEGERKNIAGMIITHGHEDHIGALFDLYPKLKCPLYATPFTAALIEAKRMQEKNVPKLPIQEVLPSSRIDVGAFNVEFISVAHSIPESQSLAIRTEAGLVVHSGDWKIDLTPVLGPPTDEKRFRELGEEGVLAYICDSTNAVREGKSPSESDVAKELAKIMMAAKNRIAVTTFASNVSRVKSVALAAKEAGRHVILVGRAMERVIGVARDQGLLEGVPPFLSVESYDKLPRNKTVLVLTGSQGEPRAAMARVAEDQHPDVTLSKGDTVIFSSRPIPGNEKSIGNIINGLIKQGIEVITDRTHLVHVSGHPRIGEMEQMYSWLKPHISIPVHGEALHMNEHAALARRMNVPEVMLIEDGDMLLLAREPKIIDDVPSGRLLKDGDLLIEEAEKTVGERRKLAASGIIITAIVVDDKGEILTDPELELIGLPINTKTGVFREQLEEALDEVLDNLPKARRKDPALLSESCEKTLKSKAKMLWGKKPIVVVQVTVV
jgi:ribonuclease J